MAMVLFYNCTKSGFFTKIRMCVNKMNELSVGEGTEFSCRRFFNPCLEHDVGLKMRNTER